MRGLRRFLCRWQNLLALAIAAFYVLVAVAAPWLAPPEDPDDPSPFRRASVDFPAPRNAPLPPGPGMPLGTTPRRWDIYHTLVWGTRYALRFGLVTTLISGCIGVLVGAASAYVGGPVNRLTLRVTDAFLTFPAIASVWLFQQVLYPATPQTPPSFLQSLFLSLGVDPVMLALILFSWMAYARITNAEVSKLKQVEYVQAARSVGAGHFRLILRHLIPNAISPAIVLAARDIGGMVILRATFTFIGVGGESPWGALLASGRDWVIGPGGNPLVYWWVFVPATLTLILFGIGWNLLGDGLNTALNPRAAQRKLW